MEYTDCVNVNGWKRNKMRLTINQVPDSVRRLALAQVAREDALKPKSPRVKKPPVNPEHWQGIEKDFQHEAERWLESIGYVKRNKKGIMSTDGQGGRRGWQIHINYAMGNSYMLDILLLNNDGTFEELELKTAKGPVSDIQQLLTKRNPSMVCRSMDEVKQQVEG